MPAHTIEEELAFASDPGRWPHTFLLPLKHKTDRERLGFLFQPSMADPTPPPEPVVYLGNILTAAGKFADMPQQRYRDLRELLADWEID